MREIDLPPFAPALIESMRSIGYSLEAAMADLIDNSIAAKCSEISIFYSPYNDPYVAILDDGEGMNSDQLTRAMQHGSRDPKEVRSTDDLGRFGLGLKTASLSQCRQLTVLSAQRGEISARCWDLDVIAATAKWTLQSLESNEIFSLPYYEWLQKRGTGTIVLWRKLDRLQAGELSVEKPLGDGMVRVSSHLALVFHRFLEGEFGGRRIKISMNGNQIKPLDPFLPNHKGTQILPEERFSVEGSEVVVRPFILPHLSRLNEVEKELAAGEDGLRGRQGFYIYRSGRLIIGGTWFRLARRDELTKLARVRVDIPNTLDHLWILDIKKSTAFPPAEVRQHLQRTVQRISDTSKRVYTYRGRATNNAGNINFWERIKTREGVSYRINRGHPLISALRESLEGDEQNLFDQALREVERAFPAEALYVDMSADDTQVRAAAGQDETELNSLADRLVLACNGDSALRDNLIDNLPLIEPFSLNPQRAREIADRLRNAH